MFPRTATMHRCRQKHVLTRLPTCLFVPMNESRRHSVADQSCTQTTRELWHRYRRRVLVTASKHGSAPTASWGTFGLDSDDETGPLDVERWCGTPTPIGTDIANSRLVLHRHLRSSVTSELCIQTIYRILWLWCGTQQRLARSLSRDGGEGSTGGGRTVPGLTVRHVGMLVAVLWPISLTAVEPQLRSERRRHGGLLPTRAEVSIGFLAWRQVASPSQWVGFKARCIAVFAQRLCHDAMSC